MSLKLRRKSVLAVVFLALAVICLSTGDARAQTNLRQSVVSSDYYRNLTAYYACLALNSESYDYDYGYDNYINQYMQNAYDYAKQAAQYALQDYNNGVTTTYYKAYNEYTTFNAIQNFLSISLDYSTQNTQTTDNATKYQNIKNAIDNFYKAAILYDVGAIYAGCFPQ